MNNCYVSANKYRQQNSIEVFGNVSPCPPSVGPSINVTVTLIGAHNDQVVTTPVIPAKAGIQNAKVRDDLVIKDRNSRPVCVSMRSKEVIIPTSRSLDTRDSGHTHCAGMTEGVEI